VGELGQPQEEKIMADKGTVYLIHFDTPLHHARHYLGWTTDLEARLEAHRQGNGARLMEVITEAGITWKLARTWEGGRELERHLKRQKNSPRFCPICQEKGARS
jgi:predicted GIY-YIG superfamily endonuclease